MDRLIKILQGINPLVLEKKEKIITDSVVDSVDLVEIIGEIEQEFNIEIPIELITPDNFDSVEKMWDLIVQLM